MTPCNKSGVFLLLGVLMAIFTMGACGPARVGPPDEVTTHEEPEDLMEYDQLDYPEEFESSNEDPNGGVLDRIFSGLTRLAGIDTGSSDKRLRKFRGEAASGWRKSMKKLVVPQRRHKRHLPFEQINEGYWVCTGLNENVNSQLITFASPPRPISMIVFEYDNFIFWLVTSYFEEGNPGSLRVYALDIITNNVQSTSATTRGANKCVPVLFMAAFVEIICVETQADNIADVTRKGQGSGIYRITWSDGLKITFLRALRTYSAQDVAIWKVGGTTFIVFANAYDSIQESVEVTSMIFKLQVTVLLDEVYTTYDKLEGASFATKHAVGVEAFQIQGRYFVAVANHRDDQGNVDIDSAIFVFDIDSEKLKPFQRIRTSAARDWTAFSFVNGPHAEYFLVVANEYTLDEGGNRNYAVESVIYKYDGGQFVPFQCIETYGAREWVVYEGSNGEFLLIVVNRQRGVYFYQYNGWEFIQISLRASGEGVERVWISWLPQTLNQLVLTVANPSDFSTRPLVYYLEWEFRNPLKEYYDQSLEWCERAKEMVAEDGLGRLVTDIEDMPLTGENFNFTSVEIEGNVTVVFNSRVDFIVDIVNSITVNYDFHQDLNFNIQWRQRLESQLNEAQSRYDGVRLLSAQNFDGLHFVHIKFECRSALETGCVIDNLIANTINGASATFDNAIRLSHSGDFLDLEFTDLDVSGGGKITVTTLSGLGLRDIPISELVTLIGNHIITADITFRTVSLNNLRVSGPVDGVTLDADSILLTVGNQVVTGVITVSSADFVNLHIENLNGRNFNEFLSNLILAGDSREITGTLHIRGDLRAPSLVTRNPPTPLDPIRVRDGALLHNTFEQQLITGNHALGGLTIRDDLEVRGRVNGVRVPEEVYLRDADFEVVPTPTTFAILNADAVTIQSNLNDITVIDGRLALLLLTGDQEVTGRKTFVDIELHGHSIVTLLVAGYNLTDLRSNLKEAIINQLNSGRELDGSVTFEGDLNLYEDLINDHNITRIRDTAIPLTASFINVEFVFRQSVQINQRIVILTSLNGFDINSLLLRNGTYVIIGPITFQQNLLIGRGLQVQTLNGFDLSELVRQLASTRQSQRFSQDIEFLSAVISDITVTGRTTVNGVDLSNAVTLNSTEIISGKKTFTRLDILSSASAGVVNVGSFGTVDGVVFNDLFYGDTLRKTANRRQNLVGRSLNRVVATSATGTDLATFARRVVYRDITERIVGSLRFTGKVDIDVLTFEDNFDGVSAEDYSSAWLLKVGSQTLSQKNTLEYVAAAAVTLEGGTVQGVDLNRLRQASAKLDETTTLARVTFDNVMSNADILLDGTIQGVNLREEVLLSTLESIVFSGSKSFSSLLTFNGEFTANGYFVVWSHRDDTPQAIDVGGLCKTLVTNGAINLTELTVDGDVNFDTLNITGSLNGEDVETLQDVFWLSDQSGIITAVSSFATVNVLQGIEFLVKFLVNGWRIEDLYEEILKRDCESQTVGGTFTLDSLTTSILETDTIIAENDLIGLSRLADIVLKDANQEIFGVITLPQLETSAKILLDGTLNNLDVETDFVQYNRETTITGQKIFEQDVFIIGDLNVADGRLVQEVDVSEFARVAVTRNENGTIFIPGITTFSGLRIDGVLNVSGTVDGIQLNSSTVILKSGDQEITGAIIITPDSEFGDGLDVRGNLQVLNGFFGDIDLHRLDVFTVRINRISVITAPVTFQTEVYFSTVTIENHLINGHNLTDLALCIIGDHTVSFMANAFADVLKAAQDSSFALAGRVNEIWFYNDLQFPANFSRFVPVQLSGELEVSVYTNIVGLDTVEDRVVVYSIADFATLSTIQLEDPHCVVGLGKNLLAVCGSTGAAARPVGGEFSDNFAVIRVESGTGIGFGHVYSLESGLRIEVAFEYNKCTDLVSIRVADAWCLVVLDYKTSSIVLCKQGGQAFRLINYLDTERAVKGAWMVLGGFSYVLVVEESSYLPAYLKIFSFDFTVSQVILIHVQELVSAAYVDVVTQGSEAFIAITSQHASIISTRVTIFVVRLKSLYELILKATQDIVIADAHQARFAVLKTGHVALYVQTKANILVYIKKGRLFVFDRQLESTPVLHPSSYPFWNNIWNTTMVAFSGTGQLACDDASITLAPTNIFYAVYREQ